MGSSRSQNMEIEKFVREVRKTESVEREKIQDIGHRTQDTEHRSFLVSNQTPDTRHS